MRRLQTIAKCPIGAKGYVGERPFRCENKIGKEWDLVSGDWIPLLYGVELFPNNPTYVGNTLSSVHNRSVRYP
jgi:hypothetical protein